MVVLEQSWSRVPDICSIIHKFLLITTFYLKKTVNRTTKSLTRLAKECWFSKIKGLLALRGKYSQLKYVCILTKFQVSSKFLKTGGGDRFIPPLLTVKRALQEKSHWQCWMIWNREWPLSIHRRASPTENAERKISKLFHHGYYTKSDLHKRTLMSFSNSHDSTVIYFVIYLKQKSD